MKKEGYLGSSNFTINSMLEQNFIKNLEYELRKNVGLKW